MALLNDDAAPDRAALLRLYRDHGLPGADDELVPRHQIFLVGGNPLPLLLAAEVLAPTWLCLLASPESARLVEPLQTALSKRLQKTRLLVRVLQDAHAPQAMRDVLAALRRDEGLGPTALGLHYSGGTKTMGQNAVRHLGNTALAPYTYIDATRDQLRSDALDQGLPLANLSVPLTELIELHDLQVKHLSDKLDRLPLRAELARTIGAFCFAQDAPDRPRAYWDTLPPFLPRRVDVPLRHLRLPPDTLPGADGDQLVRLDDARVSDLSQYKGSGPLARWSLAALHQICPQIPADATWRDLARLLGTRDEQKTVQHLATDWFEDWLLLRLSALALFDESWPSTRLAGPLSPEFELDLLARRGHQTVLISCTTIAGLAAKHKALEALQRAQRLGGDMTRHVLASFTAKDEQLATLWRELTRLDPRMQRSYRVLGLSHYRGQAAVTHCQGAAPVSQTLEQMFQRWFDEDPS